MDSQQHRQTPSEARFESLPSARELVVYFLPRVAKSAINNKKAGINNPGCGSKGDLARKKTLAMFRV
jgi:hypothetical protein